MNKCKTCEWWNKGKKTGRDRLIIGQCEFIDAPEASPSGVYIHVEVSDDYGLETKLMTGCEFGCVHHTEII